MGSRSVYAHINKSFPLFGGDPARVAVEASPGIGDMQISSDQLLQMFLPMFQGSQQGGGEAAPVATQNQAMPIDFLAPGKFKNVDDIIAHLKKNSAFYGQ